VATSTLGTTAKLLKGAWWIATDAASPTAPIRKATSHFMSERLQDVSRTVQSDDFQQSLRTTTASLGQGLVHTVKQVVVKQDNSHDSNELVIPKADIDIDDEEILWLQKVAAEFEQQVEEHKRIQMASQRQKELFHRALLQQQLLVRSKAKNIESQQKKETFQRNLLQTRLAMERNQRQKPKVVRTKGNPITLESAELIARQLQSLSEKDREQILAMIQGHFQKYHVSANKVSNVATRSVENVVEDLRSMDAFAREVMLTKLKLRVKEFQLAHDGKVHNSAAALTYRQPSSGNNNHGDDDPEDDEEDNAVKEDSVMMVENASLGLTAPIDMLKDDEVKDREETMMQSAATDTQKRKIQAVQEQIEMRELMLEVQRTSAEKQQRARQIREHGAFEVMVSSLAGGQEMSQRPTYFDRTQRMEAEEASSARATYELSFEELNQRIREKWQAERFGRGSVKHGNKSSKQSTIVVNKLERRQPSLLVRAVFKSLAFVGRGAKGLVQRCLLRLLDSSGVVDDIRTPRKAPTNIPERPSWQDTLHSV
jgi:hypothetical protein